MCKYKSCRRLARRACFQFTVFVSLCFFFFLIFSPLQIRDFPSFISFFHLSLVCRHLSHFGCSDYATNGLRSALSSSSGDINGWFRYSHSSRLTPQITTRAPCWKGLWGARRDLRPLIDTGGFQFFPDFFFLFYPQFLPA